MVPGHQVAPDSQAAGLVLQEAATAPLVADLVLQAEALVPRVGELVAQVVPGRRAVLGPPAAVGRVPQEALGHRVAGLVPLAGWAVAGLVPEAAGQVLQGAATAPQAAGSAPRGVARVPRAGLAVPVGRAGMGVPAARVVTEGQAVLVPLEVVPVVRAAGSVVLGEVPVHQGAG